jgi:hypothetical protein
MVHDRVIIVDYLLNTELGLLGRGLAVFRLQPWANLKAKQWNKIAKNGIYTGVYSENISVNPRSLCAVRCAC